MKELELYLHIPFCVQKCRYCDFLSAPCSEQGLAAYVEALVQEIRAYEGRFAEYKVTSIFFGGGTPSLLSGEQVQELMYQIREIFLVAEHTTKRSSGSFLVEADAEITMEMNPGTVTAEKLTGYRKAGVNRLSIGLQSADDRELKLLGRIHDYQTFLETFRIARECGFENINVDLISSVPGQTRKSWEQTLRKTAELRPEHLSAYSLIIEENTPFYTLYGEGAAAGERKRKGFPELPGEDEERDMYRDTARILAEYGYHRYEISNYALPGRECRHNLGYWERKEYLGLGTGSASLIGNRRWNHIRDTQSYLEHAADPNQLKTDEEQLSRVDEMEEFMFLGLRKIDGISEAKFLESFGQSIEEIYGSVLKKLEAESLLLRKGGRIRLTERGIDISNYVLADFLLDDSVVLNEDINEDIV